MRVHIAIVRPPYDRLIVDGRKVIESRFTKVACPPFGWVTPGDVVYVKRAGGPFVARAEAAQVLAVDRLTPARVDELVARYNRGICGEAAYWRGVRRTAKFATLVWLREVRPTGAAPRYRPIHMRAWYVLDADADPLPDGAPLSVALTPGCFTRGYLRVGAILDALGDAASVQLALADGPTLQRRIDRNKKMIRWAGWPDWFARHHLRPGDRVEWSRRDRGWMLTPARQS